MKREHGDGGKFVETISHRDVLGVFNSVEGPVILSADVADQLDCSTEIARQKLSELHEQGMLDRRKVSRRIIYWEPTADDATDVSSSMRTMDEGLDPTDTKADVITDE
jgi:predicted ArsR family transcriptional regulator